MHPSPEDLKTRPPWRTANRQGYDPARDCAVRRNRDGVAMRCPWIERLGFPVCDFRCGIWNPKEGE